MTEVLDIGESSCDGAALVTYVYGEGSDAERAQIAAHLVRCAACTEEVAALGETREQLAAWTPPDRALGFRITPVDSTQGRPAEAARVLTSARWWSQPLPAWAQAAAAVAIFASGLAIGAARNVAFSLQPSASTVQTATSVTPVALTNAGVSRADLAQLEARLKTEIAQAHATAGGDPRAAGDDAVIKRVQELIAASEQRQQRELALRVSDVMRDVNNARQYDQINVERRLATVMDDNARRANSNMQIINDVRRNLGQPVSFPAASPSIP
jgi:anti-sigma factor RsiW